MRIRAKLKNDYLRLELPLQEPKVSGSKKNRVIATTKGRVNTGIEYEGQEIMVVANAFIENSAESPHRPQASGSGEARKRHRT